MIWKYLKRMLVEKMQRIIEKFHYCGLILLL
jgi:hypothetical protein